MNSFSRFSILILCFSTLSFDARLDRRVEEWDDPGQRAEYLQLPLQLPHPSVKLRWWVDIPHDFHENETRADRPQRLRLAPELQRRSNLIFQ